MADIDAQGLAQYRRDGFIIVEELLDDLTRRRMETTAILLIATPTLFPTIVALGIDPVHFGIILVVNLLIGTLTPPFGVILFIMMDIAKISLAQISRAVLPFYIPLLFTLLVVTYWADFVLYVPRFFGKPG